MLLKMPACLASCAKNTLPSTFSGQTVENAYFLGLGSGDAWGTNPELQFSGCDLVPICSFVLPE